MAKDVGWELYRSFLGVLQEGSLSAAARSLGVTQPTVGRHIASLEKSLGLTLFIRSQEGLLPTETAQALRVHAEDMASTAAALARAAANQSKGVRGVVRVTASEVVGVEILPTLITGLHHDYPDLKMELVLSNREQDLLRREADIAVRMFRPRQTVLIARRVGYVELGLFATQDYIEHQGCPDHPTELTQHSLIGFDQQTDFIRQAAKTLPPEFERKRFSFSADSDLVQLALIRAGVGIGVCQVALAKRNERLVRVLPEHFTVSMEVWVTMHEDLRNSPPCRAAFDGLVAGLQKYVEET